VAHPICLALLDFGCHHRGPMFDDRCTPGAASSLLFLTLELNSNPAD
jgi:hypothetical protein